ncbi:MAG TPA: ribosome-associated ATPase/putative transporter RbbA [Bradyrhizobium sp.]|uniref:ribosome-associated ATPase/putative transporter RbbA n=1 Tax=Bradyrhizobium sp. TaxID=376 RepID=UPI002D808E14|nr:ribosome-associated ATPase/putative transporter RbbA [Bradyrhizobium sp.]HET7889812.1 ribosome-associated ATPase/putative transporter RbbA [Bradyrhizobium sp.]
MNDGDTAVAIVSDLSHLYGSVTALDQVCISLPAGRLVGLIGPDGVGKSSLLAILAGARQIQQGEAQVLGVDIASAAARASVCPRIAYMPQGLGKNLYPDLSVKENIEFFSRLFSQSRDQRAWRIEELLQSTGLAPFADRPAKKLSGGMRQKLGLCCSLIHDPDLLILDEPTTGVDPLSRRQFWDLIDRLRRRRAGMSVIVATAYMEEAERFDWLIGMNDGRILASGSPSELKAKTGTGSIEEAFVALLPKRQSSTPAATTPLLDSAAEPVIVAKQLTCRFGDFTAVDQVNFSIRRGEIFGFVGSNGSGKTTTMKMLTGLLPPSGGEALIFGQAMQAGGLAARRRVGYMSQSFSLYGELTVRENLSLHARLFQLPRGFADERIAELVEKCDLADNMDQLASELPLGIRQRLSLAVAVVHKPELLILDEPTSGVDPMARDQFWALLIDLSRNQGITIFVSTHFMNEAARCDRLSLMHNGRVLATDTPEGLIKSKAASTLEEAFIRFLEREEPIEATPIDRTPAEAPAARPALESRRDPLFSPQRLFAYTIRESLELLRDRIRLGFALFGTALLMLVFGLGISTDVNNLSFAVLDRDQTPESRAYLEELRGSPYFVEKRPITNYGDLDRRLKNADIDASIEIPPNFGVNLKKGGPVWVSAWIDGAMPFRAETIRGYLQGIHQLYLSDPVIKTTQPMPPPAAGVEVRFKYNQDFDSVFAMVPSTLAMMLALFPAILMALAVVREKELGSIINLYVTPVTRLEFLLGKQLPYVAVALINFVVMLLMAVFLFQVPLKGSFLALAIGSAIYVFTTTGYGMLISTFCRSQIAALFGTAILTILPAQQFSGMMTPVSSLSGMAQLIGLCFPMSYYRPISVGAFTKGLGFADLGSSILMLIVFVPALTTISLLLLRKQER